MQLGLVAVRDELAFGEIEDEQHVARVARCGAQEGLVDGVAGITSVEESLAGRPQVVDGSRRDRRARSGRRLGPGGSGSRARRAALCLASVRSLLAHFQVRGPGAVQAASAAFGLCSPWGLQSLRVSGRPGARSGLESIEGSSEVRLRDLPESVEAHASMTVPHVDDPSARDPEPRGGLGGLGVVEPDHDVAHVSGDGGIPVGERHGRPEPGMAC